MAEFAGSIIGIIAAGTKVAMVLSQLASDIGSAGQEARMIGSEIRTFCTILGTLKDTMDKIEGSSYYAHCFSMMRGITDASVEMFTEILNAAETLRDMTTGKDGRDGKFKLVSKVQWAIFQKPKIMVLRAAIEAYKSNIALMLGTINVVEKVARRTSLTHGPNTVVEDDQERITLQSLELDCRSSMLSLQQAEHQYNEHIMRASYGSIPPLIDHQILDPVSERDTATGHERLVDSNQQQGSLIDMAREDVKSIRSSLSLFPSEEGSLQAQIVRHSQRLSKLLEKENQRLSQPVSQFLNPCIDSIAESGPLGDMFHSALPHGAIEEPREAHFTHNDYLRFRSWLLTQPWRVQDDIIKELRADVFSERLPKDQLEVSDAHPAHVDKWLRRVDGSSAAHVWTHLDTDVAQALTVQEALPHTVIVPARGTEPVRSKPFEYGFKSTIRPHMAVREAEDLLAPLPSIKLGALEHRRSRSHDVSNQKSTFFVNMSRGKDHQKDGTDEEGGRIPMSYFRRSPHSPGDVLWSQARSPIGDLFDSKVEQAWMAVSPYYNVPNRSQLTAAETPRKEKRYSMLIENDVSTPLAQPKVPVHSSLKEHFESMGASFPVPTRVTAAKYYERQKKRAEQHRQRVQEEHVHKILSEAGFLT